MLSISPQSVSSFPGSRLTFHVYRDGILLPLSTLEQADVKVYFPQSEVRQGTIHESDHSFSVVVPPMSGTHNIGITVSWFDDSGRVEFELKITPVLASRFTLTTNPSLDPTPPVFADIYSPIGEALTSIEMIQDGENFSITERPGPDWYTGEYRVGIRDDSGYIDVYPFWIERPNMASMTTFFSLPPWHQQAIEFVKYVMMSDTEPLHPGAYYTLEEYAQIWSGVVSEINNIPPTTNFPVRGVDPSLGDVMMQGTLLRVYEALANRSASVPRWTGVNTPMLDESRLQQNWEARFNQLWDRYDENRAYAKAKFMPDAKITIDPWPSWMRGAVGGSTQAALLGHPTWYKTFRGF